MSVKDVRTHIMLDLEIAAHPRKHNPAIIQIGAIHFDIDTGSYLKYFTTHINLNSCVESGLVTDRDTLQWLERNIPATLTASQNSNITLEVAPIRLTTWLTSCHNDTKITIRTKHATAKFDQTDLQIMI